METRLVIRPFARGGLVVGLIGVVALLVAFVAALFNVPVALHYFSYLGVMCVFLGALLCAMGSVNGKDGGR